jgi:Methyltransferase domain
MPKALILILQTLVIQTISLGVYLAALDIVGTLDKLSAPQSSSDSYLPALLGLCASFAGSALLKLPLAWKILNLIIPIVLVSGIGFILPSWVFLVLALITMMLYLPAIFAQVPFYPTSALAKEKLLEILPIDSEFSLIDIGCGFGEPLFSLAAKRPLGKFYGIDLSPSAIFVAWVRSLFYRNVKIRLTNLWSHDLKNYDYVYAFLAPPPMPRLGEKAKNEMKPSAILISNTFKIPDWQGEEFLLEEEARQDRLYIYRL